MHKIQGYGYRRDSLDPRDHLWTPGVLNAAKLPVSVSLRDHMPGVYDQGQLGSCTGNAIAGIMEYNQMQAGEEPVTPSRLYIYYHERVMENTVSVDAGAEIRDGMKVVATLGVPPETDWPYDISRFAEAPPAVAEQDAGQHKALDYARVIPGHNHLRAAVAAGHPVVFGFSVIEEFESLDSGDPYLGLPQPSSQFVGGHAVVIVGYDWSRSEFPTNVFEVRNSWGSGWGDEGYFYMDAAYFMDAQLTSDMWVLRRAD